MNRILIAAAALAFAFPLPGKTQSTAQTANMSTPMTAHDVQSLIKIAHSTEQYKQLASYYRQKEAGYRAKAAEEEIERDRRAHVNAGLMQKYPRPVDSAQYLYASYVSDANGAALQAEHYDRLAANNSQHDPHMATDSGSK